MLRRAVAALPIGALGAFAILEARGFPPVPGQAYGPALFPMALGAGLVACAVLVALQAPPPPGPAASTRGRLAAAGCLLTPLLVLLGWEAAGWPLLAFALGAALLVLAGARIHVALAAGLGLSLLTWVMFAMLLRVPLPRGPLHFLPY